MHNYSGLRPTADLFFLTYYTIILEMNKLQFGNLTPPPLGFTNLPSSFGCLGQLGHLGILVSGPAATFQNSEEQA